MTEKIVVLGAGGHARVVVDTLRALGLEVIGAVERDGEPEGEAPGVPVIGTDSSLERLKEGGVRSFVIGIGSVRDNQIRASAFQRATQAGLRPIVVIHPAASVSPTANLDAGCFVGPKAVINAGAKLGKNVIVNSGALLEHDCKVGDHAHVATGAVLSGSVIIEDLAHIGAGSVIKQGVRVGRRAVVGIGAAVIKDVGPDTTVVGVPAKPR